MILKCDVFRTLDTWHPVTDNRKQVQYICNSPISLDIKYIF